MKTYERILILVILILSWALRLGALLDVPPGWRDDDLVEVYTFSNEILTSGIKLYYAEAWGQEPLYHTIRAPVLALAGVNQASVRWLSATCGVLAVLLTWAIGRRFFSRAVGILAGALAAVSFWSLMYSRVAIRHIGALPWMLLAIYWGWRLLREDKHRVLPLAGVTLGTAGAMLTYYAGRLMPVLLMAMLVLVSSNKARRQRVAGALVAGLILTIPTFLTALHTPGADLRVSELALPLQALVAGDVQPLLRNAWMTLGMFHRHGDPEWLYNIPFRPVFSLAGFAFFALSILHQALHIKTGRARVLLAWLALGISPALISIPESSLGHTILAQPATCIVLAAFLTLLPRNWHRAVLPVSFLIFILVGVRDVRDYFFRWPRYSMVNFLYRGDYRQLAQFLDARPEITEAAIGTMLFGQWDKVAVETDSHRQDALLRWVNPDRALVNSSSGALGHYLQEESAPVSVIRDILASAPTIPAPVGLLGFDVRIPDPGRNAIREDNEGTPFDDLIFNGSMVMEAMEPQWSETGELFVKTWWRVAGRLPLPPEKLYPPPYGVYGGPRLSMFTHLLVDGEFVTGDDGLWVDPYSLEVGDRLFQVHRFTLEEDNNQSVTLAIGVYDPWTGTRWTTASGLESIHVHLDP